MQVTNCFRQSFVCSKLDFVLDCLPFLLDAPVFEKKKKNWQGKRNKFHISHLVSDRCRQGENCFMILQEIFLKKGLCYLLCPTFLFCFKHL